MRKMPWNMKDLLAPRSLAVSGLVAAAYATARFVRHHLQRSTYLAHRLQSGARAVTSRPTRPIPGSPVLASRSRRVLQGSAALVAVALLAACTQAPDQGTTATPTTTPSGSSSSSPSTGDDGLAQFYEQKIAWKSCGGSFRCADLTVPLEEIPEAYAASAPR